MRVVALAARPVLGSLSARRAWIEMSFSVSNGVAVSSRSPQGERGYKCAVGVVIPQQGKVALRKESVDRNGCRESEHGGPGGSLSARRAWIEIPTRYGAVPCRMVALRKESVDRNTYSRIMIFAKVMSLSARRAWIEIRLHRPPHTGPGGRSPQGERG